MTPEEIEAQVAWIKERRAGAFRKDRVMAEFAEFPHGSFDIAGRCYCCEEMEWLQHFVVWPVPREWPPISVSDGVYCRKCMFLMGVGTDGRNFEDSVERTGDGVRA